MLGLYAKAVLGARRSGGELPDRVITRNHVVSREHLAAYDRVCGFDVSDELPLTYPHVLGFEQQLELMTGPGFGFPLLGLVHLGNNFHRVRALTADEQLTISVSAGSPAPHPKGRTFVLTTTAAVDGDIAWTGRSTYLHRGRGSSEAPEAPDPISLEGPPAAKWRFGEDSGRRYAAVSGDRNPIHLHALTAKPFGFPRPIAHGMWTAARCLAALGPRLPTATRVHVEFGSPVRLPATVEYRVSPSAAIAAAFTLEGKGSRRHLTGLVDAA